MAKKKNDKSGMDANLGHILGDTFVLYVKTLNYHWNMVGDNFFSFHKLLEEQYNDLAEASDLIAERMRMLKMKAPGTMAEFLKLSCLKEGKSSLSQHAMVKELARDHELMVEQLHALIEFSDETGDQGTSDLLIDRMRVHDKQAWLLRSHFG